jgi:hypothetical protein
MANILCTLLLTSILSSCADNDNNQADNQNINISKKTMSLDYDILDAYQLKFGNTFLFGNYQNFISEIGLPSKVTVYETNYEINSRTELDKAVATGNNSDIITLYYPGVEMWYTSNNTIIPATIDFRKVTNSLKYGDTSFDKNYTLEQFKKQFPNSANPSFQLPQSFFEMATQSKGSNLKHYILIRKTKDDPNAAPMIEFTFEKGKLIFIFFANFG